MKGDQLVLTVDSYRIQRIKTQSPSKSKMEIVDTSTGEGKAKKKERNRRESRVWSVSKVDCGLMEVLGILANSGEKSESHRGACDFLSTESVPRILQDTAKPHYNCVKSVFSFSFYIKIKIKEISYLVQLGRGRPGPWPRGPSPLQAWMTPKIKMLSCCKCL